MGLMARMLKSFLRHLKDSRGISLYEITAAVAMTGILAAVAVPVALDQLEGAKNTRAKGDTEAIFKASYQFFQDTGLWPGQLELNVPAGGTGNTHKFMVTGDPTTLILPTITGFTGPSPTCGTTADCLDLNKYLVTDPNSDSSIAGTYPDWNGPYTDSIGDDPWDRAYIFNVQALVELEATGNTLGFGWILTGGSDRILATEFIDADLDGTSDDIGRNLGKRTTVPGA